MAHDVFISYASSDKAVADAVCSQLESIHRIRCWIAPRDVVPGASWAESIIDALDESKIMVLIFSSNANASMQIEREVERAVHKGISIIPLRIENTVPTKTLEYFISAPHWLDALTVPLEAHIGKLAAGVKALLAKTHAAAGSASAAAVPVATPPTGVPPALDPTPVAAPAVSAPSGTAQPAAASTVAQPAAPPPAVAPPASVPSGASSSATSSVPSGAAAASTTSVAASQSRGAATSPAPAVPSKAATPPLAPVSAAPKKPAGPAQTQPRWVVPAVLGGVALAGLLAVGLQFRSKPGSSPDGSVTTPAPGPSASETAAPVQAPKPDAVPPNAPVAGTVPTTGPIAAAKPDGDTSSPVKPTGKPDPATAAGSGSKSPAADPTSGASSKAGTMASAAAKAGAADTAAGKARASAAAAAKARTAPAAEPNVFVDFRNTLSEGSVLFEIDDHVVWTEKLAAKSGSTQVLSTSLVVPGGAHQATVTILNVDNKVRDKGKLQLGQIDPEKPRTVLLRLSRFKKDLELQSVDGRPGADGKPVAQKSAAEKPVGDKSAADKSAGDKEKPASGVKADASKPAK